VGKGSTFCVYLPELIEEAPAASEAPDSQQLRGHETVLVVEDEEAVRRMAVMSLQMFRVHCPRGDQRSEAIRLWDQHHAEISLVFTDMVMPAGMTDWSWPDDCARPGAA